MGHIHGNASAQPLQIINTPQKPAEFFPQQVVVLDFRHHSEPALDLLRAA